MAESAGSIYYEIEADTSSLLKAEKDVNRSTQNLTKSMNAADSSVKRFDKSQDILAASINKTSAAISKQNKAFQLQKGSMSQIGYQIQDFSVQVAGGTSALVAFGQQGSQLAGIFGPGGAVIGAVIAVGSALGAALLPQIFKSTDAMKEFEKAIERVDARAKLSTNGVFEFGDEILNLERYSDQAAQALIRLTIEQAKIAQQQGAAALAKQFKDLNGFMDMSGALARDALRSIATQSKLTEDQLSDLVEVTQKLTKVKYAPENAGAELLKAGKSVRALQIAVEDFQKTQNQATADVLVKALENIKVNGEFATKEARELAETVFSMVGSFYKADEATKRLNQSLEEGTYQANRSEESIRSLNDSLELELYALQNGERAAFEKTLSMQGLTEAEKSATLATYDNIEAIKAQNEAIKQAEADYASFEAMLAQSDREDQQLLGQVSGIGQTDEDAIKTKYENQHELLRQAKEQELITEQEFSERLLELKSQEAEALKSINDESVDYLAKSFDDLGKTAGSALTSVITGAKSGKEALAQLAQTILTQVVGAIIQQGIASVTASTTAASAQVANNAAITASAAPAAAATSLASFGANSVAAVAGIAAVTAAMSAVSARQHGGPMSAGEVYRVGEAGSEVFTAGGKNYMIPGESGTMTSNTMSGGGGGSPIINVNNYGSSEVSASSRFDAQQNKQVVDIVIREMGPNGRGRGALKAKSNFKEQV